MLRSLLRYLQIGTMLLLCASNGWGQWVSIGPGAFVRSIQPVTAGNGDTVLFAAGSGVFESTDGGGTWAPVNTGLTDTDVRAFGVLGSNIFAGTFWGRIFRSTNLGTSWDSVTTSLNATSIKSIVTVGSNIFAGSASPGGFLYSSDQGSHWIQRNTGLAVTNITAMAAGNGTVVVATNSGVYFSADNGVNWIMASGNLPGGIVGALAYREGTVYAGTYFNGLYRTTDSGTTWVPLDSGGTINMAGDILAVDSLVITGSGSVILLSNDFGSHWSDETLNYSGNDAYDIALINSDVYVASGYGGVWHRPLADMVGNGALRASNPIPANHATNVLSTELHWTPGTNAISHEVYFGGTNPPPFVRNQTDTVFETSPLFGDTHYYWRVDEVHSGGPSTGKLWDFYTAHQASVEKDGPNIPPEIFSLEQNYPNPFNPSTVFSFSVPTRSFVSLEVLDLLGRRVSTVVSEVMGAGTYTRQWNASNFASGIYFYRLEADGFTETKKLILLR